MTDSWRQPDERPGNTGNNDETGDNFTARLTDALHRIILPEGAQPSATISAATYSKGTGSRRYYIALGGGQQRHRSPHVLMPLYVPLCTRNSFIHPSIHPFIHSSIHPSIHSFHRGSKELIHRATSSRAINMQQSRQSKVVQVSFREYNMCHAITDLTGLVQV
eukprot:scaffold30330_cov18-Prasinocladus_malaysianus.AAC.2